MAASEAPAPRWQLTTRNGFGAGPAEQFRGAAGGVRVGETVEAVPAQPEPRGPVGGQRVAGRRGGEAGVEGRVEAGDVGDAGQGGAGRVDAGDRPRLVQRGQVG